MRKSILPILLVTAPINAFADRYGIYDDPEYYGSGGGTSIFDILGAIAAVIFSFWFLSSSYEEWKKRRETGEKIERSDFFSDIVAPFFGYAFIAFFLSVPFLFAIKLFGGYAAVKEYWLTVGLICFGVIVFLRQT